MSKGNNIVIDGKPIDMSNIMKRMQFVEDIGSFTRKFTRIYVENNQLYIGHTINRKKTKIEYEDMVSWINYFDRI
jgi:hypothetical protein